MAVVINELEVVPEPPHEAASPPPASEAAPAAKKSLSAYEIGRLAQHEAERLLRVWAH